MCTLLFTVNGRGDWRLVLIYSARGTSPELRAEAANHIDGLQCLTCAAWHIHAACALFSVHVCVPSRRTARSADGSQPRSGGGSPPQPVATCLSIWRTGLQINQFARNKVSHVTVPYDIPEVP